MAKMKLYYSPGSPYARKVRIVAMETKLDKKMEMVNVAVSPIAPNADVEKHNPIGKIPALSVKGMDLFDSPVICEYLDNQHKGRKLLPRKGRDRWVALRQQAMADGLLDAAILTRYENALRPEDKRWYCRIQYEMTTARLSFQQRSYAKCRIDAPLAAVVNPETQSRAVSGRARLAASTVS
jgi:glutathione S-transferase